MEGLRQCSQTPTPDTRQHSHHQPAGCGNACMQHFISELQRLPMHLTRKLRNRTAGRRSEQGMQVLYAYARRCAGRFNVAGIQACKA